MRPLATVLLTVLPLVGCSQGPAQPAQPTPSPAVAPPSPTLPAGTTIWRAQSTVTGVSPTLNSCAVDNVVGQTRSVDWTIQDGSLNPQVSILMTESSGVYDPEDPPNYMSDPWTPVYFGSRTGDQFTTIAEQDGMPTCFVWHGDLTGTFSPDGHSFDAVENITYTHFGEADMVVSRHWTGTKR
jgi:hypothetical protein